ncbi:MAG: LysR family transcriptional regulator [Janthinobacterium lividum]
MTERFDLILSSDQIRTMIAVVKEGSFNKAASTLGVQQSAVTQLISRLEIKVGRRLFDRTPAGVRLTIDGEAVLIYSQAMVKLSLDLQRHLVTSHAETVLRIGLTEDVGRTALPAVLGLFARHHADFRFEAICGMPDLLFDAFDQDKLDVVIARRVAETGRGEVLWREDTVWVGAADATLPIADPISLVLPPPGGTRSTVFQALQGASRAWRVSFESASLATLEAAVRAGLGISAAPVRMALLDIVHLDAEVARLPRLAQAEFVLEHRRPARTAAIEAFCGLLRTATRLSYTSADVSP